MMFRRIESEGIAQYSYLVEDSGEAVVIDPRRDVDEYLNTSKRKGFRISLILETHRNEDYLVGSRQLAAATGAEIFHADSRLDYQYGNDVSDGQEWKVGRLKIKAIHTPGHTEGHMSYLLYDPNGNPWFVFTGDALFAGDVGRTDLLGEKKMGRMAKLLADSIFNKLLILDDGVILCPAHGAGSVCGSSISGRDWTTIGLERKHNPKLQSEEEFVSKVSNILERPPYFRKMEKLNLNPPMYNESVLPAFAPKEFLKQTKKAIILDTRSEIAFGGAHLPGSVSIWKGGLPKFAGWMLPYNKPILLVTEGKYPVDESRELMRLGYDNVQGYLSGGMLSWHMAGMKSEAIRTIPVQKFCKELENKKSLILDVRSEEELKSDGKIRNAKHMPITQLPENIEKIPKKPVSIFCGSGMRSMIAASLLRKNGHKEISVILGGTSAWDSSSCPIEIMK